MRQIANILLYIDYKAKEIIKYGKFIEKNKVNLYWWRDRTNLGDYLSVVVYEWMCKEKGIDPYKRVGRTTHLLGIGSVLQAVSYSATVWGSGILSAGAVGTFFMKKTGRKLDIRAVRGPLTRMIVKSAGYDCPEIYGDPAILMPFIYSGERREKKYSVSLVSHYAKVEAREINPNMNRINIETHDYEYFVDELLYSEKVISSSLHGIILAEVYGIPAVYLNKDSGDDLKFWDWYMSTGRNNVRYARTLEEALKAEPMEPIDPDRLANMQNQLIEAFPIDLWD